METGKIASQVVNFQKTLFENSFNSVCAIQDQSEDITESFLKQMSWIPEEGIKAIRESMGMYKKARENYKKSVDDGFEKLANFFEKQ